MWDACAWSCRARCVQHEHSLQRLRHGELSDTSVASLLTHHFLAQLLPHPTNYYLDKFCKEKTDTCPCECAGIVQYGQTSIGSPQLFYGSADIVLFPTETDLFGVRDDSDVAVFTFKKNSVDEKLLDGWEVLDSRNSEEEVTDGEFPACEADRKNLRDTETTYQLYKLGISMSMCKLRRQLDGNFDKTVTKMSSNSCILPVCGIAADAYKIVMYDAENDYLLSSFDDTKLFDGNRLLFSTIVDIWMIVYHNLFCLGPLPELTNILHGSCSLPKQVGKDKYHKMTKNSKWLFRMDGPLYKEVEHDAHFRLLTDSNGTCYSKRM